METFKHYRLHSFDEFDFDTFFEASLAAMDAGTYPWPKGCESKDDKRKIIRHEVSTLFQQPGFFGYKGMFNDEYPVSVILGSKIGADFYGAISLVIPNREGTRSWVYNPAVLNDERDFLYAEGVKRFYGIMPLTSPLRDSLEVRHNRDFEFSDVHPLLPPGAKLEHVKFFLKYELKDGWTHDDFKPRVEYKPK